MLGICLSVIWAAKGGEWLVVDAPEKADAILVLEGENQYRPLRGVQLLQQGYAPRLILDIDSTEQILGVSKIELAQRFTASLPPPDGSRATVCPIRSLSTKAEAHEADACLRQFSAHRVLIVTSDFHSRRAQVILRKELPSYEFSTASARDSQEFGHPWWRQRQWAKNFAYETVKLLWYEIIDRWQ